MTTPPRRRVLYAEAVFGDDEINAVLDVLKGHPHTLMGGPFVEEFENEISDLFGKSHGVMVNSGSSANLVALAALQLPAGSEVVTPALTFATTVAPIVQLGLRPHFVDVAPDRYVVDVENVADAISERTSALMIPNLVGNLPDWNKLRKIADRHGVASIEDSADTVGATVDGRPTSERSDISTTSFYASHILTAAGFGGMISMSSDEIRERSLLLRGWGRRSSTLGESEDPDIRFGVRVDGVEYDAKFVFDEIGYNFLPSAVAAAFGLVQLRRLPQFVEARKQRFQELMNGFAPHEELIRLPIQNDSVDTAWLAFPLIIREDAPFTRRQLQTHLERDGIQTRTIFTGNITRQPAFSTVAYSGAGSYPVADEAMERGVLIGCHHGLSESDIDYMLSSFNELVRKFATI